MKFIAGQEIPLIPASHEDPQNPGVLKRVLATRADFQPGHVQMLNWAVLPVGSSFQLHYHEDMQETFVLIRGTVRMQCREKCMEMQSGDVLIVDALEPHQMLNTGTTDAEYIVFGISAGAGGRTRIVENR